MTFAAPAPQPIRSKLGEAPDGEPHREGSMIVMPAMFEPRRSRGRWNLARGRSLVATVRGPGALAPLALAITGRRGSGQKGIIMDYPSKAASRIGKSKSATARAVSGNSGPILGST